MNKNQFFKAFLESAKKLLNNNSSVERVIKQVVIFLKKNRNIKNSIEYLELMVDMLKNYLSGTYKEIPSRSIYAILAGFIYLVAPIDAIPDTIPIAGLGDDAAVIKAVIDYILKDIETFRQWKIRHA